MKLKRKLLSDSRLCLIIDKETAGNKSILRIASEIKASGIPCIIQFRDKISKKADILKEACNLKKLLLKSSIVFIINDYLDIAKITDCDGIHIGQEDINIVSARGILGKEKIIGVSCHSLKQAKQARDNGADYIGIGPVFGTPTKPEYKPIGLKMLSRVVKQIDIPVFAIGGINKDNIQQLTSAGADRIAVVRAVCQAENTKKELKQIRSILK
ncbi:MAG: thiamine phosphate synthase [Candidatus Omnitrophota bacterium]